MATFTCTICSKEFSLPEEVLAKYPNWQPKFCREHSPKKGSSTKKKATRSTPSYSEELNLTLDEVLDRFSQGPTSGLFTDGSARPNPGPGGWGAVYVVEGKVLDQRYGTDKETTNNRMELSALIQGFQMIPSDEVVTAYTDSELCVNILTKWAEGWEERGWKRKTGPIANLELVKELYALYKSRPNTKVEWIQAHNGWLWNEYADSLATAWDRDKL